MNLAQLTVVGTVATDIDTRTLADGRCRARFRVAATSRTLDPATGQTLGQVSVGQANRFATPAIYGNLVLVPTLTGVVFVRTS